LIFESKSFHLKEQNNELFINRLSLLWFVPTEDCISNDDQKWFTRGV